MSSAAADQDGDAVGEREHRGHVVLDQHHGELALEAEQQVDLPLGFLAADAGHRLVEQKQRRLHGERDGKLERALLAVRQFAGADVGAVGDAGLFERGQEPAH